jgi:hypothetical protein
MEVESPTGHEIRYPSSTTPNDFYCNEVEMKQNGRLLQPRVGYPPGGRGGPACGWLGVEDIATSKLPIHLQYPVTEVGTYMVRFTRREYRERSRGLQPEIAEQSDWIPLQMRSAPPGLAEKWLASELAMLNSTAGRLVGEVLPSLLASRDPQAIQAMIDTSYDGNPVVAQYAASSLQLFDAEEVQKQLVPILRKRGPNDALGWLFSSDGDLALPIAAGVVTASLRNLRSPEPAEVEAAVHVLTILRGPHFRLPRETVTQIDQALEEELDFVISQRNEKAAWWIANFLGATRPPAARELLWKLIRAGLSTEQSLICITWLHDPSDLPRLAEAVKQYNPDDPHGSTQASVVMDMQTQYGVATRPYLRDILESSKQTLGMWRKNLSAARCHRRGVAA